MQVREMVFFRVRVLNCKFLGNFVKRLPTPSFGTCHWIFAMQLGTLDAHCNVCFQALKPSQNVLEALGKQYHATCFQCSLCKGHLPDARFFSHEKLPYCETCVKTVA